MENATAKAPGPVTFAFPAQPAKQCDLVMKGGITSGVVYPPAVLKLQETFRFRSIGGTSAGAIAASVTAAAEFDRENGGFRRLDDLRKQIAAPGFLLGLFKPAPDAAAAFGVLSDLFLNSSEPSTPSKQTTPGRAAALTIRAGRSLATHFPQVTATGRLIGGILGALPAVLIVLGIALASRIDDVLPRLDVALPIGVLAAAGIGAGVAVSGFLAGIYAFLAVFTRYLPDKGYFGLCRGFAGDQDETVLTTWLAHQIDAISGKAKDAADPLTFADLASKMADGKRADILLRMVTTNLSHGQPYVFPLEGDLFLFKEDEMATFFPKRIVRYLTSAGSNGGLPLPPGYYFLPKGNKLPVVFAARLSLSFPILLSAVRLYTVKPSAFAEYRSRKKAGVPFTFDPEKHFQENWFSDGGISSNFPIQFFDAWLPGRPTFGINLGAVTPGGKTRDHKIETDQFSAGPAWNQAGGTDVSARAGVHGGIDDVFLPHPRDGARGVPQWSPIGGLPGFVMSIFTTAQNYRDTMQAMLPSYRERVVQVRLTPNEGGLNLAMSSTTIEQIGEKGLRAGEELAQMDFRQHQWVRLRVLMAYLERGIRSMIETFSDLGRYRELFDEQLAAQNGETSDGKWYKPEDAAWCREALARLGAVIELGARWEGEFFGRNPPKPDASLRVTPPL
jgi:predicted acylesterase/phospholipase RssA